MEIWYIFPGYFTTILLTILTVSAQRDTVTPKPRVRPPISFVDRAEEIPGVCTQEGFSPHPTDCTKFLRCVDQSPGGKPKFVRFDFDCAYGTVYDPSISSCNFPGLGDTPEHCDAKFPGGYNDIAPDPYPQPQLIRHERGPDQRGGGHYKFITVTEKSESTDYYYDEDE